MAKSKFTAEQIGFQRAAVKRWRERNPDRAASDSRKWRQENTEAYLAYAKQYREQNKEKVKEALRKWKAENQEHVRAYQKAWKQAHRVEHTLSQQARHTKTKIKVNKEDIINWESRICGICQELIEGAFHIDHKIPLAKGGLHALENLQLAHPSCNLRKKDKL